MGIMTSQDLPIQDERLSPYNLPNTVNPLRMATTMFGLETLNQIGTVKNLATSITQELHNHIDGLLHENTQASESLTEEQISNVLRAYPGMKISKEASRESIQAGIDRRERELALDYYQRHASPGFATQAAGFAGEMTASMLNLPALKAAGWVSKGIGRASEMAATRIAEGAVSSLGGTASVRAQQLIADNASKVAFAKTFGGVSAFIGVEEAERQLIGEISGVQTPNEADFRLLDGMFNVASAGLVFGLLGAGAEKFTGKLIDKGFVLRTAEEKARFKEARQQEDLANIRELGFTPSSRSDNYLKASEVIKAFFDSHTEESERQTMDNNAQILELGKDATSDYLHEINRHEAWKRLQRFLQEADISNSDFIEILSEHGQALAKDLPDSADFEALQELATNQALLELAGKDEAAVLPTDASKNQFLQKMRDNYIELDEGVKPNLDTESIEKITRDEKLTRRVNAFSDTELENISGDLPNEFVRQAISRKALLNFEKPFKDFINEFGEQIYREISEGAKFNEQYLRDLLEFFQNENPGIIDKLLDGKETDFTFLVDNIQSMLDELQSLDLAQDSPISQEQINNAITKQFEYIKAQVIRSVSNARALDNKLRLMHEAANKLSKENGRNIKEAFNALLDRSLFKFFEANRGTFRKMNDAEQLFKSRLLYALDEANLLEFFNDPNSSSEIARSIYNFDMDLPMNEFSEPARRLAKIISDFYDVALEEYATEGVLIPKLKGRIHFQWHNPYRILRLPLRERLTLNREQRLDRSFDNWYAFMKDRIDLERTFNLQREDGEPLIDINDESQVREAFRRTFDKIIDRDFRREQSFLPGGRSNILNRRNRQRIYQFKSPDDFDAYNRQFGAGNSQTAIIRELTGMFREVELVKDWGVEPEKMLDSVMQFAESLPGWREYARRRDFDTPRRLMHLMRFGAAHSGTMFSEVVFNLKAFESVTKLGNLIFLNFTDSLTASNALNRFSIPMQESIVSGIKETFARYSKDEQLAYLRMFGISKEQYFGGFYRHFEDGTLSDRLNKMLRITMKLTGTENSEYSNRSMVGQVLSNWFATNLKELKYNQLDDVSRGTLQRYGINKQEWNALKGAIRNFKDADYVGWDTVAELTDAQITKYLKSRQIDKPSAERIDIARDELAQKYRLLMLDQLDDAVNKRSLVEMDLLRFKRRADQPDIVNDLISVMMQFKTYGFMWIRRHIGDRLYGRGAEGYRASQIQGTADWNGLMKLMGYSFAMEYAISQIKEVATKGEFLPLNGSTALEALAGSLGPIAYLSRIEGSNLTASIARILAGPIGSDIERIARIVTQFEKGFKKGDYSTAQVNLIKFIESLFGGVPMLKPAIHTMLFDNMIQNIKGVKTGDIINRVSANQGDEQ